MVLERDPVPGTIITPLLVYEDATPSIHTFKNFNLKEKFKILGTFSGFLSAVGTKTQDMYHKIDFYRKLNLIRKSKLVGSETLVNMTKNAIHLIFWTNSVANQPTIELMARLVWEGDA